jgi:Fe-S-cluster containining protein
VVVTECAGTDPPRDCTDCGCCCFSDEREWVPVYGVDVARMGAQAETYTTILGDRRSMRFREGRCVALALRDDRWICSIYEVRPDACRWLQRGSALCRDKWTEKRVVTLRLRRSV